MANDAVRELIVKATKDFFDTELGKDKIHAFIKTFLNEKVTERGFSHHGPLNQTRLEYLVMNQFEFIVNSVLRDILVDKSDEFKAEIEHNFRKEGGLVDQLSGMIIENLASSGSKVKFSVKK